MFTPVLAKHTKSFNLIDTLAAGFEPLQRQVELWRKTQVTDERAKLSRAPRVPPCLPFRHCTGVMSGLESFMGRIVAERLM